MFRELFTIFSNHRYIKTVLAQRRTTVKIDRQLINVHALAKSTLSTKLSLNDNIKKIIKKMKVNKIISRKCNMATINPFPTSWVDTLNLELLRESLFFSLSITLYFLYIEYTLYLVSWYRTTHFVPFSTIDCVVIVSVAE